MINFLMEQFYFSPRVFAWFVVIKSSRMKRTSEKIKATIDPGKVTVFIVFFKSQHTIYLFPKDVRAGSVTQSCPTLCNPVDCSPPGSFVHGISQVRILEWIAISSSKEDLSDPGIKAAPSTFQEDIYIFCFQAG